MKKRSTRKMTALLLVAGLSVATIFSGCGKKSVDYDVDDDGNTSGSGDGGELASRLGIPESYEGDIDVGDSGLESIKINDSDIVVPSSDKMSIVNYTKNTFDSEYKQTVCETIFDSSKGIYLYDYENMTKDEIEAEIETYQTMMEEAQESGDSDTEDYCKEYIEYLEEELTTAKDEREGAGDYSGSDFIGYIGENQFLLSFTEVSEGLGSSFDLSYYPTDSMIDYRPYEGASYVYNYDASLDDEDTSDISNACTFTEEEAVSIAEDFLSSCGIDDVIVTAQAPLAWEYYDVSYNEVGLEYDGYTIDFGRSVNGTAPYSGDLSMVDTLTNSDDDVWYEAATETFSVQVDSNGVISASCYPLLTATEDEAETVDLLRWDELLEKLNENVPAYYKEYTTSYSSIEFDDVELTYYCIADSSAEDSYQYVPVWVFAQADEYDGVLDYDYPIQAILVNATDGTIYNLADVLTASEVSYDDLLSDYSDIEIEGSDEDSDIVIEEDDETSDDSDAESDSDDTDEE